MPTETHIIIQYVADNDIIGIVSGPAYDDVAFGEVRADRSGHLLFSSRGAALDYAKVHCAFKYVVVPLD